MCSAYILITILAHAICRPRQRWMKTARGQCFNNPLQTTAGGKKKWAVSQEFLSYVALICVSNSVETKSFQQKPGLWF